MQGPLSIYGTKKVHHLQCLLRASTTMNKKYETLKLDCSYRTYWTALVKTVKRWFFRLCWLSHTVPGTSRMSCTLSTMSLRRVGDVPEHVPNKYHIYFWHIIYTLFFIFSEQRTALNDKQQTAGRKWSRQWKITIITTSATILYLDPMVQYIAWSNLYMMLIIEPLNKETSCRVHVTWT